jgi:hypothetical protein
VGGSTTPAQGQIYGSPVSASSSGTATASQGTPISGSGLFFGAPGQGYAAMGTPASGGKHAAPAANQLPTGNQAAQTPNYDPALGMNSVYSMMNQAPGTMFTQGQDVSPYTDPTVVQNGVPLASQISPLSIGDLGATQAYASSPSPLGNYTSGLNTNNLGALAGSPFLSALANGGKAYS